ncbi:MAG: LacI family DNA-binding transcriptional regulator [Lachnospiraceae bacterium]|nr:LacI family DNA-binding transcriptional regulator [Lachnospiraceae bacterium]
MVTLREIAKECKVSVATVSKALNDMKDVSPETKEEIKNTARRLGYYPNSSARALKTNRTYNIGVLFVDESNSGLTHDYFAQVLDSFKKSVEKEGYDLTFINSTHNRNLTYLEHSRYRGVDGVVIACVDFDDPQVLELVRYDAIPVVTIDHVFDYRIAVMSDNIQGMHDLVEYAYSKGHRRMAYISGDDTAVTRNRVGSFVRSLEKHYIDTPEEYLISSAYRNPELAYKYTRQLLQLMDSPTCIFYPDDYSAIGGINAIRDVGLSVPDNISVVGYDGSYISQIMSPRLTTLRQDTAKIGSVAAEKLIHLIENPRTTLIQRFVMNGELVAGESVADIN